MADLAVAAGGTASWELAFLKVPALIFILADNQAAVAKALDEFGTALRLGRPGNLNREELAGAISHLLEGYRAFRFGKGGLATGCSSSRKSRDDVFESPRLSLEVSGYTDNVPISTSRFPFKLGAVGDARQSRCPLRTRKVALIFRGSQREVTPTKGRVCRTTASTTNV